jgi:hypothetical protein
MVKTRSWALWLLPFVCCSGSIAYLALTPSLAELPAPDAARGEEIGRALRGNEAWFRQEALRRFPGDPWSQGDHFGRLEADFVRAIAAGENLRPGAVLEAIDRDVRAAPYAAPRRGWVPPCMPRPFYD